MPVDHFVLTLALVGAVIVLAALLSGLVERSGVPQVAVFLGIGAVIGPPGAGLLDAGVNSPLLRAVATISLVLVLFTDALSLSVTEVRRHKLLSFLVLGPGTLLSAAVVAFLGWRLLGLSPALAAILGAALASTDPVLLRALLRRPGLDPSVKQALRLESGMNDAVLLPVVLVGMAVLSSGGGLEGSAWGRLFLNMLVVSPMAGVLIALGAIGTLDLVRRQIGVRRDYESLYSIGVAFAAYAAGEVVHGSGFLAAFFAGLTISALDVELCDCFRDYGETTAEMTLLFTFVLFGTSVIWSGLTVLTLPNMVFAAAALLARPAVFVPALLPAKMTWRNRALIAWFGPRALSTLLLVLLPVFAGLPGTEALLPVACLVVLVSVIVHGLSPALLLPHLPDHPKPLPLVKIQRGLLPDGDFITVGGYKGLKKSGSDPLLLDVRSERHYNDSDEEIPGALRIHPDRVAQELKRMGHAHDRMIIAFCACPEDATAVRVVEELRRAGWVNARVLRDGWSAWKEAGLPVALKA